MDNRDRRDGWRKVRLGEICDSVSDGDHLAPPKSDTGVPFITISNIDDCNNIDFTRCMYVPRSYYDRVDAKRKAQPGDVLYSVVGSFGKPVLVRESKEFVFQRHIAILRPNQKVVDSRFLYSLMRTPKFYAMADSAAIGTAQRTISLSSLRSFAITLPPLPIQQRIAEILGAYDDAIENNRRRIALLEKMARELYRERFVRRAGKRDWVRIKLGDFITFIRGVGYGSKDIKDGDDVLLSMNNIRPFGGFIADYARKFSGRYREEQKVDGGDLIMAITDMTQDRRIIGYTGIVEPGENNRIICTHLMKLSSGLCHNYFLNGFFNYSNLSRVISEQATGATVLGLTADVLKEIQCDLPPKTLRDEYTSIVSPIIEQGFNLALQNRNLARQRDRLLPRLMSGRLEVGA